MTTKAPRVLIAEDDWLISEDLRILLEELGFNILNVVSTGKQAIESAKQSDIDLMILDVRLKGEMDGIQTALAVRNLSKREIPILFITGQDPESLSKIDAPTYILTKPWNEIELRNLLMKILDQHQI